MKTARIQVKSTGKWFWYYARLSWGQVEYSFDGDDFYSSKSLAFRNAEAAGTLQPASLPRLA